MLSSTAVLVVAFGLWAAVSLGASSVLIVRIERIGVRLGVTESVLGLAAAVAADAPEITSAITAMMRGQHDVGVGVVLGANVFQLAALLGLGALAAGGIQLDRGLVVFEGLTAGWIALIAIGVVAKDLPAVPALLLALLVFVPYVVVSGLSPEARERLPIPASFRHDVEDVLEHEERDIQDVLEPLPRGRRDGWHALIALILVVVASVALEGTATDLGHRWGIPDLVLGGVILAIVTSLPNLVAAIYLARRGRGAATLSEAMNSNRVNTLAGLLVPAVFLGTAFAVSSATTTLAYWYGAMTAGVLALAFAGRGLNRVAGVAILAAYVVIVVSLVR